MKRVILAAIVATSLSASSGCCIMDKLFAHPYGCGTGCDAGGCGHGVCGDGGCHEPSCDHCSSCDHCGPGGPHGGSLASAVNSRYGGARPRDRFAGPATGAITYPYYTTRGPRDFLAEDPRGIGP